MEFPMKLNLSFAGRTSPAFAVFGMLSMALLRRNYFALFLLVMLAIEVVAYVFPMGIFHKEVSRNADQKAAVAKTAGREICAIKPAIAKGSTTPERQELEGNREQLIADFATLGALPRWLNDSGVRRRSTFGTGILLVVPLLSNIPVIEWRIGGIFK